MIDLLWSGRMFLMQVGFFICQVMHLVIAFVSNTMFFELLKYEMSRTRSVITCPAESVSEVLNYRDDRTYQSDGQSYSLCRAYNRSLNRNQSSDRVL